MTMIRKKISPSLILATLGLGIAFGAASLRTDTAFAADGVAEKTGEQASKTGRNIKRKAKKAKNRVEEKLCMEGDLECAREKAKNRIEEGADATRDKAKDLKDKVD